MNTVAREQVWRIRSTRDLGRAISGIRRQRGLNQAELAEKAGIERTYLSRLETDHSTIAIERALRALRRMGAEVTVTLPSPEGGGDAANE